MNNIVNNMCFCILGFCDSEYNGVMFDPESHPHRRRNPLLDEWIIVSPHRTKRPWNGQIEKDEEEIKPRHDPTNPLCPGVTRASGKVTESYTSTYVFDNDFPALLQRSPVSNDDTNDELFKSQPTKGLCRVMCFHPHSDVSLPLMSVEEILKVIETWIVQYTELYTKYTWVQIFENKGSMMGCSNAHPHCQIWACDFLPHEPRLEDEQQIRYFKKHNRPLLLDYVQQELQKKERIVVENEHWLVVVPYWAMWPYELLLLPKTAVSRLNQLSLDQQKSLAAIMKIFLTKYDNLFHTSFPYSMGWHGAPNTANDVDSAHWLLHAHYYPPLIRSATVKKHMVGFEMLAGKMRDFTPEKAAALLRDLPSIHYKNTKTTEGE